MLGLERYCDEAKHWDHIFILSAYGSGNKQRGTTIRHYIACGRLRNKLRDTVEAMSKNKDIKQINLVYKHRLREIQ